MERRDAGAITSHARQARPAGHHPRLLPVEERPAVGAEGEGARVHGVAQRRILKAPRRHGREEAEALAPVGELLLRAEHAVVGERLDLLLEQHARRVDAGGLAARQRRQGPDVPARAGLARELERAEDVRPARHVGEARVGARALRHRALRGATDTAAVEELRLTPVEAPIIAGTAVAEAEDRRALDKERALLLEEGIDVAR